MNRKRLIEGAKSALIALLAVSTVFLGWRSGVFAGATETTPLAERISAWLRGGDGGGETPAGDGISAEAARPLSIVLTDGSGVRFAAKYDRDELNGLYGRVGRIFKEALGSAREPSEITELQWRSALGGAGICVEYLSPVQLSVLDGWLGTDITGLWREMTARRLCVYADGGAAYLAFADAATGLFYRAGTSVSVDSVASQLAGLERSGVCYAFETDVLTSPEDPYLLIFTEDAMHPFISASNPFYYSETLDAVLTVFGVNRELSASYPEDDGTLVFVEKDFTIRISPGGTLTYRLTGAAQPGAQGPAAAVEAVRALAAETVGAYCGGAEVQFLSAEPDGSGGYSVEFCYCIAGGRIFTAGEGCAVRASVGDGAIRELTLVFRTYEENSAVAAAILPELQAAAAAGGAHFILGYSDSGASEIYPEWLFG